jgi:hypothetical protein
LLANRQKQIVSSLLTNPFFHHLAGRLGNCAIAEVSVIPVLVTGIQPAQVIELKESFDPTDVGSLYPRHKGEDDGKWGAALAR